MKFLLIVGLFFPLALSANSLKEALDLIERGDADLADLVVKVKDPSKKLALSTRREMRVRPLFGAARRNATLSKYQQVAVLKSLDKKQAMELMEDIYQDANVEMALFMPRVEDAFLSNPQGKERNPLFDAIEDFEPMQNYLKPAPEGINAPYAWTLPGGTGKGVRIIDIETGWKKHPELLEPFWNFSKAETDHGVAVLAQLTAKPDAQGVTGIAHDATWGFISRDFHKPHTDYHDNVAVNIGKAVEELSKGDLLVLEMHSPGPAGDYIPVEYWQPVFDIVKYATDKGILCVAAAGNGSQNLDAEIYKNAFNLQHRDSGCVLVGASTNQANKPSASHAPAYFTNYGSRVDAHGYGENVVTAGYGDLLGGAATYTAKFSGTSSATPIVGGAVAVLSGIAKARGEYLTPLSIREAFRKTGTPQNGDESKRIGHMPDLEKLVEALGLKG